MDLLTVPLVVVGVVVSIVVVLGIILIAYRRAWRIPEPNEALIIVGKRRDGKGAVTADEVGEDSIQAISEGRTEGLDFRISTAATWVNPLTSRVFQLPLDSRSTDFEVDCHDSMKIACKVRGVILFKVGDNYPAMAAAARRFLSMNPDQLNNSIRDLVTGQVRALVGSMTIPELITDRQKLMDNVREATHEDMARLGLSIDSLSIQDISDANDYISNLGRPQAEQVSREAAVASNLAREATERSRFEADLKISEAERNTEVQKASYQAERDRAHEEAAQAGPLARAKAQEEVVAAETRIVEMEVERTEKKLDATVRKQAEAERYATEQAAEAEKAVVIAQAEAQAQRTRAIGDAEAQAAKIRGEAEAAAIKAKALAEAEGLTAKGNAFAEHGQMLISDRIAEQMTGIAEAVAAPLGSVENMVVLDGPEGLTKAVVGGITGVGSAIKEIKTLGLGGRSPDGGQGAISSSSPPEGPAPVAVDGDGDESAEFSQRVGEAVDAVKGSAAEALAEAERRAGITSAGADADTDADPAEATGGKSIADPELTPEEISRQRAEKASDLIEAVRRRDPGEIMSLLQTDDRLVEAAEDLAEDPDFLADMLDRAGINSRAARRLIETGLKQLV